jgi:hypothetical protein
MRISIVESGGNLSKVFQESVGRKLETATFEAKKALDLFDVLAYSRRMISSDQLVIITLLNSEELELNKVFFQGLATLEAETGKNIFKCFYNEDEDGEAKVKELAETFIEYLFSPAKSAPKKPEEDEYSPSFPI